MYPSDLRYTSDHEWARKASDGTLTVGITDFAQKQLGNIVFIEILSQADQDVGGGEAFGTIESVKAVTEVFAPVGGKITATNDAALNEDPELVNTDPYGEGWLIKLRPSDAKAYDGLMTAKAYEDYLKTED